MSEIDPATMARLTHAALAQPHGLVVTDRILRIKSDNESVQVTLGWDAPSGAPVPQSTLVMTKTFALSLAKAIQESSAGK